MLVQSQIKTVTVYKDRALVERLAKVNLKSGDHQLIFGSLPNGVDPDSIQVSGGNSSVLQEIKLKSVHLDVVPDEQRRTVLLEIEELEALILENKDKLNNLNEEKSLLQKLANLSADSPKKTIIPLLVPDKMHEMLKFYGDKLNALDESIRTNKKELAVLEKRMYVQKAELNNYHDKDLKIEKQVHLKLFVKEDADISIVLSYIVMNAGWKPIYDFRLESEEKKLFVHYNALVKQSTGEKWENVRLYLSTARPHISAIQPQLNPWYVDVFQYPPPVMGSPMVRRSAMKAKKLFEKTDSMMTDEEEFMEAAPMEIAAAQVETGASSVNFLIQGSNTIMDNGEDHKIGLNVFEFQAMLEYNSVPKLSPFAYLTASTTNNTDFPLLPGNANIYLDNGFVGHSEIKLVAPNQLFHTSLGIDEGIQIEHKLINKFSKDEGLFSKKNKIIYEYRITVENHKKIEAKIKIRDQVPISQNQEIKIELIEPKYKEDSPNLKKSDLGIIEWSYNLKPAEKLQFDLKFSAEFSREIEITGLD